MKHTTRLACIQYVTDPATGKAYPIPAGGAEGEGEGDGGEGEGGEGQGGEGDPTPLEQQALDAVEALKSAGAEIPEALNAAVREFREARSEAAKHRTAKAAEKDRADQAESRLSEVMKALGIDDDTDPDPDTLKQHLADRDRKINQTTVQFDAYKQAGKHGANPDALLDSASFLARIADLDPSDDKYEASLEGAIKTAVENNPLLKQASPGGGRRGPQQGPTPSPDDRPKSMQDAVASRYQ